MGNEKFLKEDPGAYLEGDKFRMDVMIKDLLFDREARDLELEEIRLRLEEVEKTRVSISAVADPTLLVHGEGGNALSLVQDEVAPWQEKNFPGRDPWQPLVGMMEELGEICHAFLKREQKIRKQDYEGKIYDGLADLLIFACDFANSQGVKLDEALLKVWKKKVQNRDWVAYRKTAAKVDAIEAEKKEVEE